VNPPIDNKKYFITFMDEFSRKIWIFTLKSKSEAQNIIIDGAKEYKNKIIR